MKNTDHELQNSGKVKAREMLNEVTDLIRYAFEDKKDIFPIFYLGECEYDFSRDNRPLTFYTKQHLEKILFSVGLKPFVRHVSGFDGNSNNRWTKFDLCLSTKDLRN